MKPSMFRAVLIGLLSAGWLLPLAWAASSYIGYLNLVLLPKIQGHVPLASAPLDHLALIQLYFSLSWLAAVIVCWSYAGYRAIKRAA